MSDAMIGFTSFLAMSVVRYEALVGGRPLASAALCTHDLSKLIHTAVDASAAVDASVATRKVWLDLTNGESLLVGFEQTRDDSDGTCTMRVRQTRVTDACELDDPSGCVDVGCVSSTPSSVSAVLVFQR